MANSATVNSIPVGALYGLPGFTEQYEQYENLAQILTTQQLSAQTPFNPPGSFQKTDVVFWWELEMLANWAETYSAGTLALSPEAPYNILQNLKLKLQGQYSPLEVESGFDAAFMQMYRPMRGRGQRNLQDLLGTNPVTAGGFANSLIPQANLAAATLSQTLTSPYVVTTTRSSWRFPQGFSLMNTGIWHLTDHYSRTHKVRLPRCLHSFPLSTWVEVNVSSFRNSTMRL